MTGFRHNIVASFRLWSFKDRSDKGSSSRLIKKTDDMELPVHKYIITTYDYSFNQKEYEKIFKNKYYSILEKIN